MIIAVALIEEEVVTFALTRNHGKQVTCELLDMYIGCTTFQCYHTLPLANV